MDVMSCYVMRCCVVVGVHIPLNATHRSQVHIKHTDAKRYAVDAGHYCTLCHVVLLNRIEWSDRIEFATSAAAASHMQATAKEGCRM